MEHRSRSEGVEMHDWQGEGYRPFVEYGNWLVALMNWEERFDLSGMGQVERHNETDEVFVLLGGRSILLVAIKEGIRVFDMRPGTLYNVKSSTWHNVIGTKDAKWLIVESSDTGLENSDYRSLDGGELSTLRAHFPDWLRSLEKQG